MRKILILLLFAIPFASLAQLDNATLKSQINTNIRSSTYSPTKTATVLDNIVDSKMGLIAGGSTSGTDNYTASASAAVISYVLNTQYTFKFGNANTGASTMNVNSLGTIPIKKRIGASLTVDLAANDILAGMEAILVYDGTNFQLISPIPFDAFPSQTGNANKFLSTDATTPNWAANFTWDGTNKRLNVGSGNTNSQGADNWIIGVSSVISFGNQGAIMAEGATIERTSGTKGVSDNGIFAGYLDKITTTSAHLQNGSFSNFIGGGISNQILDGTSAAILSGRYNIASNESSVAMGEDARATGFASFAHGYFDRSTIPTPTGGASSFPIIASGTGSFNFSANNSSQTSGHGALAARSFILNTKNGNVPIGSPGSGILGGYNIKARDNDSSQVYVPNFNIAYVPLNDDALTQILVRDATTGQVKYRTAASIGAAPAGSNTQIQFNNAGVFGATANLSYDNSINTFRAATGVTVSGTGSMTDNVYIGLDHSNTTPGGNNSKWNMLIGENLQLNNSNSGISHLHDSFLFGGFYNKLNVASGSTATIQNSGIVGSYNSIIESNVPTFPGGFNGDIMGAIILGGQKNKISPSYSNGTIDAIAGNWILGGGRNISDGHGSGASGYWSQSSGTHSMVHGYVTTFFGGRQHAPDATYDPDGGSFSHTGTVARILASGKHAVNISANSTAQTSGFGALADYSVILGGYDHNIPSTSPQSAIFGGSGIVARASDPNQVYVPNLNIASTPTNNDTITHVIVRDYATGALKTRKSSSFSFTPPGSATQIIYNNGSGTTNATANLSYDNSANILRVGPGLSITGAGTRTDNFYLGLSHTDVITGNASSFSRWNMLMGEQHTLSDSSTAATTFNDDYMLGGFFNKLMISPSGGNIAISGILGGTSNMINSRNGPIVFGAVILGGDKNVITAAPSAVARFKGNFILGGSNNASTEDGSGAMGYWSQSSGKHSLVHGFVTTFTGGAVGNLAWPNPNLGVNHTGTVPRILATGKHAINISANSPSQTNGFGALGDYSAIIAGRNSNVASTGIGSLALGGYGLNVTDSATVGVPNLQIFTKPVVNDTISHFLVIENSTGKVKRRNASSFTASPAGSTTQIQFNNSGAFGATPNLSYDNTAHIFRAATGVTISGTGGVRSDNIYLGLNHTDNITGTGRNIWNTMLGEQHTMLNDASTTNRNLIDSYILGSFFNKMHVTSGGGVLSSSGLIGSLNSMIEIDGGETAFGIQVSGGVDNLITPKQSNGSSGVINGNFILAGGHNISDGHGSGASGYWSQSSGTHSFVHGYVTSFVGGGWSLDGSYNPNNNPSHTGTVPRILASGKHAINISANSSSQTSGYGALADYSAIFAGRNHNVASTAIGSVAIGGYGINLTDSATVGVPNLLIAYKPVRNDTINQILVRDYTTGQIKYKNSSALAGWNLGGTTTLTSDATITGKSLKYDRTGNRHVTANFDTETGGPDGTGGIDLKVFDTNGTTLSFDDFTFKLTNTSAGFLGMQYGADYSANYLSNPRSIPDLGTVQTLISGASVDSTKFWRTHGTTTILSDTAIVQGHNKVISFGDASFTSHYNPIGAYSVLIAAPDSSRSYLQYFEPSTGFLIGSTDSSNYYTGGNDMQFYVTAGAGGNLQYSNGLSGDSFTVANGLNYYNNNSQNVTLWLNPAINTATITSTNTAATATGTIQTVQGTVNFGSTNSSTSTTNAINLNQSGAGNSFFRRTVSTTATESIDMDSNGLSLKTGTSSLTTRLRITDAGAIGFFNVTPVAQQGNTIAIDQILVNFGLRASGGSANFVTTIKPPTGTTSIAPIQFSSGSDPSSPAAGQLLYTGSIIKFVPISTIKRFALTNDVAPSNGQLPIGNGTDYTIAAITQGTNIAVTNGSGSITVGITGIIAGANGGTNNGFMTFTGPTTSLKTFTLPDASATILTSNAAVTGAQGGTGQTTNAIGDLLIGNTSNTWSKLADVATGNVLISGGVTTAPSWGKVDLTAHVTGILPAASGGNGNGFFAVTGPTTSTKTFTFPNASATVLTDNAAVTVAQGGIGVQTLTAFAPIFGGTTSTGPVQSTALGTAGWVLTSNGAGALPTFQAASSTTLTGAIVYSSDINPTITADQNDYNPSGFSTAYSVRLSQTGGPNNWNITGLSGGTTGRFINLINNANVGTGNTITLKNNSASSTSANRFNFTTGDFVLNPGENVQLIYSGGKWKSLGFAARGGNGISNVGNSYDLGGQLTKPVNISYGPSGFGSLIISNDLTASDGVFTIGTLDDATNSKEADFVITSSDGSILMQGGSNLSGAPGMGSMKIDTDGNLLFNSPLSYQFITPSTSLTLDETTQTLDIAGQVHIVSGGNLPAVFLAEGTGGPIIEANYSGSLSHLGFFGVTAITKALNTVGIDQLLVNYGLRQSGGSANFATGIITRASTTTLSAFVIPTGVLLTTPAAGNIENNGTNLFFTPSTTRLSVAMDAKVASGTTTGTFTTTLTNTSCFTITPTGDCTFNAAGGIAGQRCVFVVTTSGTTNWTLTFGSNFKTTGTLLTGILSGKVYAIEFVYDGTNWNETSRTIAM